MSLLTVGEVAAMLRVSPSTVRNLARGKGIEHVRIGGRVLSAGRISQRPVQIYSACRDKWSAPR